MAGWKSVFVSAWVSACIAIISRDREIGQVVVDVLLVADFGFLLVAAGLAKVLHADKVYVVHHTVLLLDVRGIQIGIEFILQALDEVLFKGHPPDTADCIFEMMLDPGYVPAYGGSLLGAAGHDCEVLDYGIFPADMAADSLYDVTIDVCICRVSHFLLLLSHLTL